MAVREPVGSQPAAQGHSFVVGPVWAAGHWRSVCVGGVVLNVLAESAAIEAGEPQQLRRDIMGLGWCGASSSSDRLGAMAPLAGKRRGSKAGAFGIIHGGLARTEGPARMQSAAAAPRVISPREEDASSGTPFIKNSSR